MEKHKVTIITQVLNYGTWDDVKWWFKVYPEEDIREVLRHPRRGMWFEKVLNFWTQIYRIRLDPLIYQAGLFSPHPRPKLMEKYFKRYEKGEGRQITN